jgi:predicted phage terminase large subunit-like protein
VAYTRLQPGGAIVLIQTRWHEDDLAGRLLNNPNEKWNVLSLPAIAEVEEPFRRVGDPLWPERYPLMDLQRIRESVGSAAWASLYQQRPAAAEGAIFKRGWIRTYRDLPNSFKKIVQSCDTAFKAGAENDYSLITTWGVTENGYFLISFWRGRVEFPELKRQVAFQADQWKPHVILIEDKASGQSLVQELMSATRLPIVPVKVDSDKRARAEAVTPLFEAGRIFVPESAPWLDTYIDELAAFPVGTHDDAVDSTTQALNYLRGDSGAYTILELMKKGWDGFPNTWRAFQKAQALGERIEAPKSTQITVEVREKWAKERKAPPCPRPDCNSTNTILIGGQTGPVVHCNDCSADDGVLPIPEEKPDHVHRWRTIPCGEEKCDDCGEQRPIGNGPRPATNGISRAQYAARNSDFRNSFGRFG